MTRPVEVMAGEHPVEAAIREGKIPESRRAHYMGLMAKSPKKTKRLLARLAAVLDPPEEMDKVAEFVASGGRTNTVPPGDTAYPEEWTRMTGGGAPAASVGGNIYTEEKFIGQLAPEFPASQEPGEIL